MDTENLIKQYKASKAQTEQFKNELCKHQLEAAMRAYEALRDAYACGVVMYDDDRLVRSKELLPCKPCDGDLYGMDRNGNVILRFTHYEDNPHFIPEDFQQM